MSSPNLFENTARFYDLDCRKHAVRQDLPLWRRLARRQGSPVLDLACGTGRVALDLAARGHEVWGIDASESMLRCLDENTAKLDAQQCARLHVERQDLRSFDLRREFALILIAYRSFQALPEPAAAHACLQCVRRHLADGGLFVFGVLRDIPLMRLVAPDSDLPDWEETLDSGERVVRANRIRGFDAVRRVFSLDHVYRVHSAGGPVREYRDRLDLRVYSEDEIGAMLLANGLRVRETRLDYDGKNLGGAEDWIFICEKG